MKKVALIAGALVLGVTSIAVASTRDAAVPKASLTSTVKVHDGKPLGAHSVGHIQLKNSVIDCQKLVPSLRSAVCSLSLISNGGKGDKGDSGPNGSNGTDGKNGADGTPGLKGDKGPKGQDASVEYGIASVWVSRGHDADQVQNPATKWATYSVLLGSPVGDNTGGIFRFTCSSAKAPCVISARASVTGTTNHTVKPRVLIYNAGDGDGNGAPLTTCEYLDGPFTTATPAGADVALGAGGSFDCGLPDASYSYSADTSVYDAGKTVTKYIVPAGYYDVQSTFAFLP